MYVRRRLPGLKTLFLSIRPTDSSARNKTLNPCESRKETDQVHLGTQAACTVLDPVWNRRIIIAKSGSDSTVIWNPWVDKTKQHVRHGGRWMEADALR